MLIIGGAASAISAPWNFFGEELGVGVVGVGAGIGVTILGVYRENRYLAWYSNSKLRPPSQGNGLLAAGTMSLIASVDIAAVSGTTLLLSDPRPAPFVGLGTSAFGFALGIALLTCGTVYRSNFERWQSTAKLLPTGSFGPNGGQFGLTGRF